MLPPRPSAQPSPSPGFKRTGSGSQPGFSYDSVKKRVLAKLENRMDLGASKRMPPSLLRQSLRQQAEALTDVDARAFSKADRERMIDEVLSELLGYGPLEELFADPGVREVMVTGPAMVIARRDQAQWLPTSVKFRDDAHVRAVLDKIAAHADAVGPVMTSVAAFDMKLPNGFRALAVIPPEALGAAATASFVRETAVPAPTAVPAAAASPTGSTSNGTLRTVPASVMASPRQPGSALLNVPASGPGLGDSHPSGPDPLIRYRNRILERLLKKLASLQVYDVQKLDAHELEKIVAAYVSEFGETERIYISDPDQARLTLEILTALRK
jgi:hypothetical protein